MLMVRSLALYCGASVNLDVLLRMVVSGSAVVDDGVDILEMLQVINLGIQLTLCK